MASLFGRTESTSNANATATLANDVQLANGPEDSISSLAWSTAANHLAVGSWDNKVRIYDVTVSPVGQGRALMDFDAPVLSCDWSKDGRTVIGAGVDKTARILDLAANGAPPQHVAMHDAPIKSVRFFEAPNTNAPMIVTGSWDKTAKYWDLRQQAPVASLTCAERVYSLDVQSKLMVIGTADRYYHVVDLNNPTTFFKTAQTPLKWQTRVISCFIEATGFAIGGIEGRCAFQYVTAEKDKDDSRNFTFRCHRDTPSNNISSVYAVNAISFHPVHGTFSTAGADGTYHFWDKEAHHRLKAYPAAAGPISATAFNRDGSIFAYAVSYDWSKGYSVNTPQYPNKIMMHPVDSEECKPRPVQKKR